MEKTAEQKYVGNFDEVFPIIDASELVGHRLLAYMPKTERQERLMNDIWRSIDLRLPAFRAPCMDPSEENGKIVFKPGNRPAVGHYAVWWDETWGNFMPSKNSRSGTDLHRAVFLGNLMKYLVDEKNYSVTDAWKAVCDDSCDLGHYWNAENVTEHTLECTGSRKVGIFFDLANTSKVIKKWESAEFWIAGGNYLFYGNICPLAHLESLWSPSNGYSGGVGWLVMDV